MGGGNMAQPLKHPFDKHIFSPYCQEEEEGKMNYTDCVALLLDGGRGSFVCFLSMLGYFPAQQEQEKTRKTAEEKQVADRYQPTSG